MTPDCCIHSWLFTFQRIHTAKERTTNGDERFSCVIVQHKVRCQAPKPRAPRCLRCLAVLGIASHDFTLIPRRDGRSGGRSSVTASHQPLQTETLEGPEEGVVLGRGRFPGRCGLTGRKRHESESLPSAAVNVPLVHGGVPSADSGGS